MGQTMNWWTWSGSQYEWTRGAGYSSCSSCSSCFSCSSDSSRSSVPVFLQLCYKTVSIFPSGLCISHVSRSSLSRATRCHSDRDGDSIASDVIRISLLMSIVAELMVLLRLYPSLHIVRSRFMIGLKDVFVGISWYISFAKFKCLHNINTPKGLYCGAW